MIAVFLTLTFSSCSCIYFNTFHNIRKNFNGAEKSRNKGGRDKAQGIEVKQYNDAITKSSRVLERHPTSSWVDDALYIIGASYYYLGDYEKSSRKFKELFANYPQSEYAARSRLLLAKAKLQLKEEAEAVVLFEEIFEKENDKKMKADAARALGEYYFTTKDFLKADQYFMALIDSLGDAKDKLRASLYVADGNFERYAFRQARDDYKAASEYQPDSLQYYHITYRMAECEFFINDLQSALSRLQQLADNQLYFDSLGAIRLKMAEGYQWDGDFETATSTYERIITENPGKDAAAIANFQLGLIYQYDFEDLEKARGYYNKAKDEKRNSPIFEEATRRVAKLALLEQYTKSGAGGAISDSAAQADQKIQDQLTENQFLLGELFFFDLERPDSALHAYQVVLDKFPNSRFAPRALISMSHIYRNYYSDTTAADTLLREVLTRYPRSDEAQTVIGMLGLAGTVADTGYAAITFAKAEQFFQEFRDLDSSMYYQRRIADSLLIADSGKAKTGEAGDTTASQGVPAGEALDEMQEQDMMLKSDSASLLPAPTVTDSARVADSIQQIDSLRIIEARRAADSIRAAERKRIADSLRTDAMQRRAAFMREQAAAKADSTRRADSIPTVPSAPGQDSTPLPDLRTLMEAMQDTGAVQTSDTTKRADSLPAPEQPPRTDSLQTADSTTASDTTLPQSVAAPADSAKDIPDIAEPKVEEPVVDFWGEAFTAARDRYSSRMMTLLDSASYYYHRVIDSFPQSDYSLQARYVLLWMYDRYLAPADSSLMDLYTAFVDSFPRSEYAQAVVQEYNIRSSVPMQRKQPGAGEQEEQQPQSDTTAQTSAAQEDTTSGEQGLTAQDSKFITGTDGKQLQPANEYFLREDLAFEYPLEALAFHIEDWLYFHIRISFSGEVVELKLINKTASTELNDRIIETVKNTKFDAGRIAPEMYDGWFYYKRKVEIPTNLRQ